MTTDPLLDAQLDEQEREDMEREAHAAKTLAALLELVAADPASREILSQCWHLGWTAGWNDRAPRTKGAPGMTRNPFHAPR